MTNPLGQPGRPPPGLPTPPSGWPVGSYTTYAEAQRAVDHLSDENFSVQDVTIVGVDLMQVERVTGRLTWPKVIGGGIVSGAWLGLFFGLLLGIFSTDFLGPLLVGLVGGIVFGLISATIPLRRDTGVNGTSRRRCSSSRDATTSCVNRRPPNAPAICSPSSRCRPVRARRDRRRLAS